MDPDANLEHWERWADQYGTELRATTKCLTIKRLELEAVARQLERFDDSALVLEVGCGNGVNGFGLLDRLPRLKYLGVDFAQGMIDGAATTAKEQGVERAAFAVGDARALSESVFPLPAAWVGDAVAPMLPVGQVDVLLTVRMIINLRSADEQLSTIRRLATFVRPGGLLMLLENSAQTHGMLNEVRMALGLPPRPVADFNVFIDEDAVIAPLRKDLELLEVDDFAAIHDLVQYAVVPSLGDGEIPYDSPLMTRLTSALLRLSADGLGKGAFGQNRLWVWRRP